MDLRFGSSAEALVAEALVAEGNMQAQSHSEKEQSRQNLPASFGAYNTHESHHNHNASCEEP